MMMSIDINKEVVDEIMSLTELKSVEEVVDAALTEYLKILTAREDNSDRIKKG